MEQGLHKITAEQYHADPCAAPSLSASIANIIATRSSLHAWHAHPRLNPNHKPEQSSVMDAGSVAHAVLLEGGTDRLVVVQADDWKTKAAREQRDQAWAGSGIPILARKLEDVNAMVSAAKKYIASSELAGVFDKGDAELTMIWREGKAWCRARPDWLTDKRDIMVHYKSTATVAEPNVFTRQIVQMGYDYTIGHYQRGCVALKITPGHVFLVQENEAPYACSLVGMSPANMDLAERKADYALGLWKGCIAKDQWNGYPRRICYAEPPEYAVKAFEERSALEEMLTEGVQA